MALFFLRSKLCNSASGFKSGASISNKFCCFRQIRHPPHCLHLHRMCHFCMMRADAATSRIVCLKVYLCGTRLCFGSIVKIYSAFCSGLIFCKCSILLYTDFTELALVGQGMVLVDGAWSSAVEGNISPYFQWFVAV